MTKIGICIAFLLSGGVIAGSVAAGLSSKKQIASDSSSVLDIPDVTPDLEVVVESLSDVSHEEKPQQQNLEEYKTLLRKNIELTTLWCWLSMSKLPKQDTSEWAWNRAITQQLNDRLQNVPEDLTEEISNLNKANEELEQKISQLSRKKSSLFLARKKYYNKMQSWIATIKKGGKDSGIEIVLTANNNFQLNHLQESAVLSLISHKGNDVSKFSKDLSSYEQKSLVKKYKITDSYMQNGQIKWRDYDTYDLIDKEIESLNITSLMSESWKNINLTFKSSVFAQDIGEGTRHYNFIVRSFAKENIKQIREFIDDLKGLSNKIQNLHQEIAVLTDTESWKDLNY